MKLVEHLTDLYDARVSNAISKNGDVKVHAQNRRLSRSKLILGVHTLCTPVHRANVVEHDERNERGGSDY